jgi:hypothetical protein
MKIIDIYPKDVFVNVELSLAEVEYLVVVLNKAQLRYDSEKPTEVKAIEFVKDRFFPMLNSIVEENKDGS